MSWIRAFVLAFSTYSRIPMPQVKWDDTAARRSIAFLPFVGCAVGGAFFLWQLVCRTLGFGPTLFAAVAAALPVLVTGGIHMDGFCDTSDALASWQDTPRRLEILKDPHVGAFALIRFGVYLLVSFAVLGELFTRGYDNGLGWIFVLSRCLAAYSAMLMPNARKDGMLAAFTVKSDRRAAVAVVTLSFICAASIWIWFTGDYRTWGLWLCAPLVIWYSRMAKKRFGGATGDTTGYLLQIIELALMAGTLIEGAVLV